MQDNSAQAEFWTEAAGPKWVAQQERLDALMQPVLDEVLRRADLTPGDRVLDIGCGTGASTLQVAEAVGNEGMALGADISATMLALARHRATGLENVAFVEVDAARHAFESSHFDHLISRFGVMFFADPAAAFANMRRGLKPGARVSFATWGPFPNNPWFGAAVQAAKETLGAPPSVDPDEPGPFAFRKLDRVTRILSQAGFEHIEAETSQLGLTPPGALVEVAEMATSIGPAARTLEYFQGSAEDSAAIAARVETAFRDFETPQGLRIPAEINFFQARCPTG